MEFNYLNLLQMIKNGGNPQQLIMSFLESSSSNNPMNAHLFNLAKGNQTGEIENIARNICQQKGMDFDKEFASFKKILGM